MTWLAGCLLPKYEQDDEEDHGAGDRLVGVTLSFSGLPSGVEARRVALGPEKFKALEDDLVGVGAKKCQEIDKTLFLRHLQSGSQSLKICMRQRDSEEDSSGLLRSFQSPFHYFYSFG